MELFICRKQNPNIRFPWTKREFLCKHCVVVNEKLTKYQTREGETKNEENKKKYMTENGARPDWVMKFGCCPWPRICDVLNTFLGIYKTRKTNAWMEPRLHLMAQVRQRARTAAVLTIAFFFPQHNNAIKYLMSLYEPIFIAFPCAPNFAR